MSSVSEQRQVIAAELADVHTCLPGVIVSYDGQMATVRPSLDKQLANGETLSAPQIAQVPVCWPCGDIGGGQALISVPLRAGDAVLLHFSERALDDWLNGTDGPPGDPRQFDLSDAFATPMMRPGTVPAADLDTLTLRYGPGAIRMAEVGRIDVIAPAGFFVNGLNVNTHIHAGVVPGGGTSASPVPGS